jgi:hypothetical protein
MVRSKNFGRGVHALMLVEEPTNIACKLPVVGLSGGVQRSGRLTASRSYFPPPFRAARDKTRQCPFAPRNGNRSLKVAFLARSARVQFYPNLFPPTPR